MSGNISTFSTILFPKIARDCHRSAAPDNGATPGGSWQRAQSILLARFATLGVQFDF